MKNLCRNLMIFVFAAISLLFSGKSAFCQHDIWLIDTHSVPWMSAEESDFAGVTYYHFVQNRWIPSGAEAFYSTQSPDVPLIVYTPGYTATTSDTVEVGMEIVRLLKTEKSYRIVFWDWPASKITFGLGKDIRSKIPITMANGIYQGMFLRSLKPHSRVCLLGFSFGNRIICDAVEMLKEGKPSPNLRIRLVLTASATDQNWLGRHSRHAHVPEIAEKILILYNPMDRALRFYHLLYGVGCKVQALGRFGPPICSMAPEYRNRIEAVNVYPEVGPYHRTIYHLKSAAFRKRLNTYLFFEPH
ncbi:MAG: alpha/beta hydrolase [Planctomycetaceae bacterium]|nr:alpha/beta hydrolase [Planctomycetaceae bacterium]